MFSLTWKRIAVASALMLVLLAPFCVCYPPAAASSQGGCHGMPEHAPNPTPACCSVSPAPQPLLASSLQYEPPTFLMAAIVVVPVPITTGLEANTNRIVLSQSPPETASILRI